MNPLANSHFQYARGREFRFRPELSLADPRFLIIDGQLGRCPCCASIYSAPVWNGAGRECRNCGLRTAVEFFDTKTGAQSSFRDKVLAGKRIIGRRRNYASSQIGLSAMSVECLLTANNLYPAQDVNSVGLRIMRKLLSRVDVQFEGWNAREKYVGPIALGMISRVSNSIDVAEILSSLRPLVSEVVVAVDTDEEDEAEIFRERVAALTPGGFVELQHNIFAHRLSGHFAAHRNAVMDRVSAEWVLWMDTDERPDRSLLERLPNLIGVLRRQRKLAARAYSIVKTEGRECLFSGYSETRLMRSDVRFIKPVHEQVDVPWHRIFTDLSCRYVHEQFVEDQVAKSAIYEQIAPGAGKPIDLILKCLSIDGTVISWIPEMEGFVDLV